MISISRIHTKILSDSHQNHPFLQKNKIYDQSNSLNSVRFCNISVRPGDHVPFLETHGNSVRLGRSVSGQHARHGNSKGEMCMEEMQGADTLLNIADGM